MTLSHEDLLLLILSDQRWHSLHEILRRHPMTVHSRAAALRPKLRTKGYTIEHRCTGKGAIGSEYRLRLLTEVGLRERVTPAVEDEVSRSSGVDWVADSPASESSLSLTGADLSGEVASAKTRPSAPVSDRPLTPEGDGKSGLHGGSFSPSDVSGPVSPSAADDPLNPAPAAHLPAPAPWLESLPVPGQLTLSEEAA